MDARAAPQLRSRRPHQGGVEAVYRVSLSRAELFGVAALSSAAVVLVYLVEVCTEAGQRQDADVFGRFQSVPFGDVTGLFRDGVPALLGVACVALGVRAVRRRQLRAVVAQALVVLAAALLSEILKSVLPRPFHGRFAYTDNTFPSSHVAITAALGCAAVLLWGTRRGRREAAFVVSLVVVVAMIYNVTGFAHRPSDVVGGFLVAVALEALGLAAFGLTRPRRTVPEAAATQARS